MEKTNTALFIGHTILISNIYLLNLFVNLGNEKYQKFLCYIYGKRNVILGQLI